ncbi:MAG: hypothetical protein KDA41_12595 [Planctomycetales bacterium]|nr:hypothetical protein [Planctomycetales bacterium]
MTAIFDKLGIRFSYPDNWTLDESEALEGNRAVSVYSPEGAFWAVVAHEPDVSPEELAATALATMRGQYDELDAEQAEESVAGRQLIGYDMNFYCLDLTNTAIVRSFRASDAVFVVFCQAEDREFVDVEPIFRALTRSLVDSTSPPD